jgi:DNA-binding NarL/FixJ family response regulator
MSQAAIRVLLVEDQVLMRRGLRKLLEMEEGVEVVAEAADGIEALRRVADSHPDVALVDAQMPRMNGVELIARLGQAHPEVRAIILTTFEADEYIFGGLRAGARGYLLKDTPPDELVAAIRKVSRGETILHGAIASRVVAELRQVAESARGSSAGPDAGFTGEEKLSAREAEVARLVARAATNREIALALFVTEGTVKNHISSVLRKLALRDRTELAVHVIRSSR